MSDERAKEFEPQQTERLAHEPEADASEARPLVSVLVPAFNEAVIIERNLEKICAYLGSLEDQYRWELLVVDDGSTDATGPICDALAGRHPEVRVLHHRRNFGLGQALRYAFGQSRGEYVVTLDSDLSYSPDHIGALLEEIRRTDAKLVLASPYMPGGLVSNVPRLRAWLSRAANRFLAAMIKGSVSTLTGMVRAYDGRFLRGLALRSESMEINPEVLYKTLLLGGRVSEVPAHLNWETRPEKDGPRRSSSIRVLSQVLAILLAGFILRPVIFFLLPGLGILIFSAYTNTWMVIHFLNHFARLTQYDWIMDRASWAVAAAYQQAPHTFIVGLTSLMLAVQLIGLAILSLQSKNYFEELFSLGTAVFRSGRRG